MFTKSLCFSKRKRRPYRGLLSILSALKWARRIHFKRNSPSHREAQGFLSASMATSVIPCRGWLRKLCENQSRKSTHRPTFLQSIEKLSLGKIQIKDAQTGLFNKIRWASTSNYKFKPQFLTRFLKSTTTPSRTSQPKRSPNHQICTLGSAPRRRRVMLRFSMKRSSRG